jgi:hypothetical protein
VTDGENIRRAQWLLCALSKVGRHLRLLPAPPARPFRDLPLLT